MSGTDSKPYSEKVPLHWVPMEFVWAAARALKFGVERKSYVRDSWTHATEPDQYLGACLRHLTAMLNGEVNDSDGQPHINGACASLAIYAWHVARGYVIKRREPTGWVMDGTQQRSNEGSNGNGKHANGHASV